jgi:hypothetical protein
MKSALRPCERCHRHVRLGVAACPFCDSALVRGLGVVAIAGASLAMSGCELTASAQELDDPEEAVRMTPQYGAPSYDPGPPPTPQPPDNRDAGPRRPHRAPRGTTGS